MNIPCILIPALVGLICGILGYLIGKMSSKKGEVFHSKYLQEQKTTITNLTSDLDFCRSNEVKLKAKISDLENKSLSTVNNINTFTSNRTPSVLFNSEAAYAIFGKRIKENDLKAVEGIGPKIEELLHNAGINTWKKLSETSATKLQAILDAGGESFSLHNPGTWTRQAELAYSGKWKELKEWQDILDGGKD
ncbi:hypothetical protein RB619_19985 [Flavobacterium sp. LHD-80]|uniref:hypothetical protein n=1 Tax=Flavobacterium sp. LHD-80 TaxID=3071411 RepID=UPI0027E0961E|nr:hypothetical protein [Flavobacterium sp. LHD-80]MDQ6472926.1 hypothetical protein [Flavobacterium sp. LHD-80]